MVAPIVRQIDHGTGSLDTEATATDVQTGLEFQTLSKSNRLIDITNAGDPTSSNIYLVKLIREGREVRRWTSPMLLTTVDRHVGFPVDVGAGQIQWYVTQTAGTAAAQSFMLTYLRDL